MIWLMRELPDGSTLHFARLPGRPVHFTTEIIPGRKADVIRALNFAIPAVQRAIARGEDVTAMLAAWDVKLPGRRRKKSARRAFGG